MFNSERPPDLDDQSRARVGSASVPEARTVTGLNGPPVGAVSTSEQTPLVPPNEYVE